MSEVLEFPVIKEILLELIEKLKLEKSSNSIQSMLILKSLQNQEPEVLDNKFRYYTGLLEVEIEVGSYYYRVDFTNLTNHKTMKIELYRLPKQEPIN